MKIRFILITLAVFLISGTAWAERMAVMTPFGNIRSGPGKAYDILWKVEKYHPLRIIEKAGNWYRFRDFEGDEGWIHSSLLSKIPTVITRAETCNIRQGPGLSHRILFTAGKGIPFKVLKREGRWINIQHADGDKGWIHQSLIW